MNGRNLDLNNYRKCIRGTFGCIWVLSVLQHYVLPTWCNIQPVCKRLSSITWNALHGLLWEWVEALQILHFKHRHCLMAAFLKFWMYTQTCSQYVGSGKWCVVKHSSLQWYLGHLENFIISISDPLFVLMVWSFCSPHGQSIKHTRRHRMGNKHEPEHICYFSSTDLCSINNAAIRSSLSVKVWTLSSLSK